MLPNTPSGRAGLQAVLFDLDGTVIDSEPYWIEAEYALVEEFGGRWSDEQAHHLVGSDLLDSGRYIQQHGPVPLSPEEIVDRLVASVLARIAEHAPWRPGAWELLADLRAHDVPCALVTMSYAALTELIVAQLPAGTFAAVVSGDIVNNGKPHPEPYLTAARMLGVEPRACVAIEDSPTGVASAEAAGCVVLAVPNHVPIPDAPSRRIVTSLTDLDAASLATFVS